MQRDNKMMQRNISEATKIFLFFDTNDGFLLFMDIIDFIIKLNRQVRSFGRNGARFKSAAIGQTIPEIAIKSG
jgi:hypothetical protein